MDIKFETIITLPPESKTNLNLTSYESDVLRKAMDLVAKKIEEYFRKEIQKEFEIKKRFTDDEVIKILQKEIGIKNVQEVQKYNKINRELILNKLRNINGISCGQLSRVLGINKKIIERLFKN